jgi:hypothetical protein
MSIKQMRKKITDRYGENNRVVAKFDSIANDKTKTKSDIEQMFEFLSMFFLDNCNPRKTNS